MTDQRELDRLLDAFFADGTDELADRVIDAALDQIGHTRQRRAVRMPWRFSTMNMLTRLAAVVVIGVLVGGGMLYLIGPSQPSSAPPSASGAPMTLSIANGTTIAVTLIVNGKTVEIVPPGGYEDPIKAVLPELPWNVETRSPSGRVLSSLTVRAGDVVYTTPDPSGRSSAQGDAVRVDLSCGRLDVWSGPPLLGPVFSPGPAGDCA